MHTSSRTLSGAEGYRRLARLVARAFYSGEVPPPEAPGALREGEGPSDGPVPVCTPRAPKYSFKGLAVLLVDYLARVAGYEDEVKIAADLRLSQKNIRKVLRYLESERIVSAETVKLSFKRQTADDVDDPDVEEKKRKETHVFWCLDYPRLWDMLRLKLHHARDTLKKHAEGLDAVQLYLCPRCGAQFSSLDAASLIDPLSGTFRCEHCQGELVEHVEGPVTGARGGASGTSRRERQDFFKDLHRRFEAQLKPIIEQMEKIRDVPPPDSGSLQDWYQNQMEEAKRRAERLELARKKVAAAGGAADADLTEEQLLEWAERAEVVVALPGMEGPGGAAAVVAAKELPAWFRRVDEFGGTAPSASVDMRAEMGMAGTAAAAAGEESTEEQRRRLEQRYLEQYLAQIRTAQQQQHSVTEDIKSTFKMEIDTSTGTKVEETTLEVKIETKEEQALGAGMVGDGDGEDELDWEDA